MVRSKKEDNLNRVKWKSYLKRKWKKLGRKVFLKRELHGLLKAEGSVLSTMFLNIC